MNVGDKQFTEQGSMLTPNSAGVRGGGGGGELLNVLQPFSVMIMFFPSFDTEGRR